MTLIMTTTFITDPASISSFNRGPVTSIFSPPASCLSTLTWANAMYFGYGGPDNYADTACYPSSTLPGGPNAWEIYYYSPAQCPLGWSQATQATSTFSGIGTVVLSLGSATTAVVCCPSGYFYVEDDQRCQSAFTYTTSTLNEIDPVLSNQVWYSTAPNPPLVTTVVADPVYNVFGSGIPVWWQSSDLEAFAKATRGSSSPSTMQSSIPTKSTSSATTTPTPNTSHNGLSTGAKIGIGIGIPLTRITIGIVAFFITFRTRTLRLRRDPIPQTELQVTSTYGFPGQALELPDGAPIREIYSDNDRFDHPSEVRHELPSR